jgi:hypothetical protein
MGYRVDLTPRAVADADSATAYIKQFAQEASRAIRHREREPMGPEAIRFAHSARSPGTA